MYVCICHNITDQKLQETLKRSKGDFNEVIRKLGMGKGCGTCLVDSIEKLSGQKSSKRNSTKVG